MPEIVLSRELMPDPLWNTHIACLTSLCAAATRNMDEIEVAGITGLAFRTSLSTTATPAGLYHSVNWPTQFRHWLDLLGLDAEVSEHQTYRQSFDAWASRQHFAIQKQLERGFPVLYFDNVAFGLILGSHESGYYTSGVPAQGVHPAWLEHPDAAEFISRLIMPQEPDTQQPKSAPPDCFRPRVDQQALLAYTHGVVRFDAELAAQESIYYAYMEMLGQVEAATQHFDLFDETMDAQFGTPALDRWREQLKQERVHHFGTLMSIQSQIEARKFAELYLKRLPERLPAACRGRIEQVAEFMGRVNQHWRKVLPVWSLPLDANRQMTATGRQTLREALYQVQQTEETAARLLGSVAKELFS